MTPLDRLLAHLNRAASRSQDPRFAFTATLADVVANTACFDVAASHNGQRFDLRARVKGGIVTIELEPGRWAELSAESLFLALFYAQARLRPAALPLQPPCW